MSVRSFLMVEDDPIMELVMCLALLPVLPVLWYVRTAFYLVSTLEHYQLIKYKRVGFPFER